MGLSGFLLLVWSFGGAVDVEEEVEDTKDSSNSSSSYEWLVVALKYDSTEGPLHADAGAPNKDSATDSGGEEGGEEGYRLIELKVIFIMINVVPRTDRAEKIQVRGSIMRVVKIDNVEVDYLICML